MAVVIEKRQKKRGEELYTISLESLQIRRTGKSTPFIIGVAPAVAGDSDS